MHPNDKYIHRFSLKFGYLILLFKSTNVYISRVCSRLLRILIVDLVYIKKSLGALNELFLLSILHDSISSRLG